MKTLFKISLVLIAFLVANYMQAQISDALKIEIEKRIKNGDNPSIAIGFFKNNKATYYVSGYQNVETKTPATTATLYEIGSITKTITGLLFSKMILENKVSLTTPLNTIFPDSLKLSDPEGRLITYKDVATHTSGLHSFPMGYNPPDPKNPYAELDKDKLYQYLSNWGSPKVGDKFGYSNIAVGLMGEGLAIIENTPYTTLIEAEILKPLKLKHTYFEVPTSELENFADGYQKGTPTPHWDLNVLSPAGGLKSNIEDLLSYGVSYLKQNPLTKAQQATIPTQYISEQGDTEIGINWFKKGTTISHGGGTYGFSAYLVVDLEKEIAVAVLTNTGDQNITDIHSHLLDPENNRLFTENDSVIEVPLNTLNTYEGIYKNSQYGLVIAVMIKDNKLYGQVEGQRKFEFDAITNNSFINKQLKAQLTFESNKTVVNSFTLSQNGQNIVLNKQ